MMHVCYLSQSVLDVVRADKQHAGERWALPDMIGSAVERVAEALRRTVPSRTVFAAPHLYSRTTVNPTTGVATTTVWPTYSRALYRVGGVIEASAPHVLCSPSANVTIEPDGTVLVTSTHDQLFTSAFAYGGATFPTTAPGALVHDAARAIARACAREKVIGHIGIDFVLWFDSSTQQHRLWAVDLNLHYTATQASFQLFDFLMKGRYELTAAASDSGRARYVLAPPSDAKDSKALSATSASASVSAAGGTAVDPLGLSGDLKPPPSPSASSVSGSASVTSLALSSTADSAAAAAALAATSAALQSEERYYSTINYVYDPGLATVQFGSFFNLCRLRGVAFDLRARLGTAFVMMDSLASGTLGVLCVGRQPMQALRTLVSALDFLMQHVAALKGTGGGAAGSVSLTGPLTSAVGTAAHVYADQSNLRDASVVCKALLKAKEDSAALNAGGGADSKLRARTVSSSRQQKKKQLSAGPKPTTTPH
jgi:hypothetical protein